MVIAKQVNRVFVNVVLNMAEKIKSTSHKQILLSLKFYFKSKFGQKQLNFPKVLKRGVVEVEGSIN